MRYEEEPRRTRRYEEDLRRAPLDAFKCKIPPFIGDGDAKSYLEWEMKLDQVLECFNYDDYVKVRKVTYEFSGYALRMYQGLKSVEEYYKNMNVSLMRVNVLESNEAT
ncbi:hypothetical protein CR513_32564, partial [Mucuna pruriens]